MNHVFLICLFSEGIFDTIVSTILTVLIAAFGELDAYPALGTVIAGQTCEGAESIVALVGDADAVYTLRMLGDYTIDAAIVGLSGATGSYHGGRQLALQVRIVAQAARC